MKVQFGKNSNGDHYTTTVLPVLGGSVRVIARVTDRELREMYRSHLATRPRRGAIQGDELGLRISLRSLGGAINAIAKPATLLKLTTMAARVAIGDPTVLLQAPGIIADLKKGLAAKRVLKAASEGDPKARRIVDQAREAARAPSAPTPTVPGIDAGVMRYIVTVQRLAQAS
jgi:hypothetical protein